MQLRAIGDIIFADVFGKRTNRHAVYCSHAIEWDQTCVDRIRNKVPCATAKALRCVHNIQVIPIVGQNDFP